MSELIHYRTDKALEVLRAAAKEERGTQVGKVLGAKISDVDKVKVLSGNAQRILARRAQ
jgi:hypothetical protein